MHIQNLLVASKLVINPIREMFLSSSKLYCNVGIFSLKSGCCGKQLRLTSTKSNSSKTKQDGFVIQPVGEKDMVGPPDPISNIRPILIHIPPNESEVEKHYRLQRDEVQQWNQEFWKNHNTRFFKGRENFIKDTQKKQKEASPSDGEAQTLTADEMSVFYKKFLDENWLVHVKYNKEWYKKNLGLLFLSFKVQLLKSFQMLQKKEKKH